MTDEALEQLALLMEPRPQSEPLGPLRKKHKVCCDWEHLRSPHGWWRAQIGWDGGEDWDLTDWQPRFDPDDDERVVELVTKAEAEVAARKKQDDYIANLWAVLGLPLGSVFWTQGNFVNLFAAITAGPEQRLEAVLKTLS